MTAPNPSKNAPAKASPAKQDVAKQNETNKENTSPVKVAETPTKSVSVPSPAENTTEETPKNRIPEVLSANPILVDFCQQYLSALDEIAEYNKEVLAEKSSEWNVSKVMEKARLLARPIDKNVKAVDAVKTAVDKFESLMDELAKARKNVLEVTTKELGIPPLSSTAERNPEIESALKEKRKVAGVIGNQLDSFSSMIRDEPTKNAVTTFLLENPLPAIGRDQVRTFGNEAKTPKYRVSVNVKKDGNVLLEDKSFTQTALALSKPVFGYERGKQLTSDNLREAWEKAGNSPEKTVQETVEFEDNGLVFTITKK